jgi:S-adenosylmethionine:tRNA ribosyltransferase-isomerase
VLTPPRGFSTVGDDSSLLAAYDYQLPEAAIAQRPAEPRSAARLLVDLGAGVSHRTVADLPGLLRAGDVVVVNETKVLAARLLLQRAGSGGRAEVLLLEPAGGDRWVALVRPGRRLRPGDVLVSPADGTPVVEVGDDVAGDDRASPGGAMATGDATGAGGATTADGRRYVRLLDDPERHGAVPLPPYIHEPLADPGRYQTVYARVPGSAASPTAGLHLTPEVLAGFRSAGVEVHAVDLAIGLDTFRPISSERVADHRMHSERYRVPPVTLAACEEARARGSRVVAVGTTTVRSLESAAATGATEGRTDLFITPGFEFRLVDVLLTNFHLPKSSLLVLLAAFAGYDRWRRLYAAALDEGYRFLSFGDAMLVSRAGPAGLAGRA